MTNAEKLIAESKTIAEANSKPGTFSLLDRLQGRSYPKETVDVYLDEEAGYEIQKLEQEIARTAPDDGKIPELEAKLAELQEQAQASRLTFHLEGISSEEYDSVVEESLELFPVEYHESRNPLTMALERTPKENEDRETYFRIHLWAKFIRRVEDAEGDVDSDITPALIAQVHGLLPLAGMVRLSATVDKLKMVTNWMDEIQGADFLVKS